MSALQQALSFYGSTINESFMKEIHNSLGLENRRSLGQPLLPSR